MDNELKAKLEKEIHVICDTMNNLEPTCEDYQTCQKNLQVLMDELVKIEKMENDAYEAEQKRSQEFECKDYEFDLKHKQQIIDILKVATGLAIAVGGGVLKIADMSMRHEEINRITKYEEENNILGIADKAIAQKVPPRDW